MQTSKLYSLFITIISAAAVIFATVSYASDRNYLLSEEQGAGELPNVLIIGDSISIGYTPKVRKLLEGVANVHAPKVNSRDTRTGLKHLKDWLGTTRWDVIHFNWGLHDLCYRHPDSTATGHRDKSMALFQYQSMNTH